MEYPCFCCLYICRRSCNLVHNLPLCSLPLKTLSSITACFGFEPNLLVAQVIAKTGTHRNGLKPPTVMLQFNRDFEVGSDGVEASGDGSKMNPDSLKARPPPRSGGLVSLNHHHCVLSLSVWLHTFISILCDVSSVVVGQHAVLHFGSLARQHTCNKICCKCLPLSSLVYTSACPQINLERRCGLMLSFRMTALSMTVHCH